MPETENKCRNYHNEWINRYLRELIKTGISRKNTEKIQFSFFLSPVLLFPIWIVAIIRGEDIQKFTKKVAYGITAKPPFFTFQPI